MVKRTGWALAYLTSGFAAGPVGLLWSLVAVAGVTVLAVTQLGGPAFLGAAWVTRLLATAERHRAGWIHGAPIGQPYLSAPNGSLPRRVAAVGAQPATWRDLAWLVVLFPVGMAAGLVAIVGTAVTLGAVTAPAWAWAVPNPHAPFPMRPLMTTVGGRFVLTLVGLALVPLMAWLLRQLARVEAGLARALLAPGEHRRLVEETARLARTRARVVDAQAAELRRIERDLHDGAQARIVAAGITLALAARKLRAQRPRGGAQPPGGAAEHDARDAERASGAGRDGGAGSGGGAGDDGVAADVSLARRQLDEALADLRRLVRGIHPPILTDRGLHAALAALAADSPLAVELRGDPAARFPAAVESAAYFVVAEGLANATKHADAASSVVDIGRTDEMIFVRVTDNGRGGADPGGTGLDGLRRRVEALDGTLAVDSPMGGPTVLLAEFPCAS